MDETASRFCRLLDFTVHGVLPHDGIVFLQFHAVGRVLAVLLGDVARGAGQAAVLVLGALQDDLDAVAFAFLSHCMSDWLIGDW